MNYYTILASLFIALMLSFLFAVLSPTRTPWRGVFLFFLIIFLAGWASQLWITPFGPVIGGVAFFPLLFVGLIFSLLIAVPPPAPVKETTNTSAEGSIFAIGVLFWFLILVLLASIAIGYYKIPPIISEIK